MIDAYNEAWNRHDLDGIVAFHAPGMVFENYNAGERAEGDAVRSHIGQIFENWPDLRFTGRSLYVGADFVVQEWTAYATHPSGVELKEPSTLALLEEPHSELRGDATIRPWLWSYVDQFVPRSDWATTCARVREKAVNLIATRHELTDRCAHAAAMLRAEGDDAAARIQARRESDSAQRATGELALVEALSAGVASPRRGWWCCPARR